MKLTHEQQDQALAVVAEWLGKRMTEDGSPCPTGHDAAMNAEGPMLNRAWGWPTDPVTGKSDPTPTILLEGGPYDWAVEVSMDLAVIHRLRKFGVFAEPWAGYALCLYGWEG